MGTYDFKYNNVPPFARKPGKINTLMSAAPKLALVPASRFFLRCNLVIPQCVRQVSLRLKEVQMGTHDFKYNKVPFFCSKNREYQYFDVWCPETSSCARKPL